jgi:hypothetical protein
MHHDIMYYEASGGKILCIYLNSKLDEGADSRFGRFTHSVKVQGNH